MHARKVNEDQNFTRGGDPYAKLGIGRFKNVPRIGQMQGSSFDLHEIAIIVSDYFNLRIHNYTPIDEKSNYNWNEGYQTQFERMNVFVDDDLIERLLGPEYYKKANILTKAKPPMSAGITAQQKHWISKHGGQYEYTGHFLYIHIDAGGYTIPINLLTSELVISDSLKDTILQRYVWNLHYDESKKIIGQREDMFDVRDFVEEYGREELESLLKQSYTWNNKNYVKVKWEIIGGYIHEYK